MSAIKVYRGVINNGETVLIATDLVDNKEDLPTVFNITRHEARRKMFSNASTEEMYIALDNLNKLLVKKGGVYEILR